MHKKHYNCEPNQLLTFLLSATLFVAGTQAQGFGIQGKGILKSYGQPVHETITQKAAIDSGLFTSPAFVNGVGQAGKKLTEAQQEALKYLIEGVRFNDDPEGYFMANSGANQFGSPALRFGFEFIGIHKENRIDDPSKASHFGDYQYLHSMGSAGMSPSEIRGKIDRFIYHCWRMATDPNSYETFKKDYEVISEQLKLEQNQNAQKSDFKYTPNQIIVRKSILLFPKNVLFFHATNQMQFQYRALGALLHIIQDSYAKGHVVRVGWEEGDNSGNIRYFQDYSEQESSEHSAFDNLHNEKVAGDNFVKIPGAKMAYLRSKQFLSLVAQKCPWTRAQLSDNPQCSESVYGFVRNVIFAIEPSSEETRTHAHPDLIKKQKLPDFSAGG